MVFGATGEQVSIHGEYFGKIFDHDVSVVVASRIQWHLPGLASRVAITSSPTLGTDLLDCQSQYIRETMERETKNEIIILHMESYEPISCTTARYTHW